MSPDSESAKNQNIENLKATIGELEKTIAGEFDKKNIAELEHLKAELLRVLARLENKVQ